MKKTLLAAAALLCGCTLMAASGEHYKPGFRLGNFEIAPVVNTGLVWDSNPTNSTNNEDASFLWRLQFAATIAPVKMDDRRHFFTANLFYNLERGFDGDEGADTDSYGISAFYRRELSKFWNLTMNGAYTRSESDRFWYGGDSLTVPSIYTDRMETYNFNIAAGYRGPKKWMAGFGVGWNRSHNMETDGNNNSSFTAQARVGHVLPAISQDCYLTGSFATTLNKPEDGDGSLSFTLLGGITGSFSDRTNYGAMIGLSYYHFRGDENDTSFNPAYNLSIARKISKRMSLAAAATSSYEGEDTGNANVSYVWSHHVTAALNLIIDDKTNARFNASQIFEDHTGVSGRDNYARNYIQLQASVYRQFYEAIFGYVSLSYRYDDNEDNASSSSECDDIRLEVGLSWRL